VFSTIKTLVPLSSHLIEQLHQRIESWTATAHQSLESDHEDDRTLVVGDLLAKLMPFYRVYHSYGYNYHRASRALSICMRNETFALAVERIEAATKASWSEAVGLESLLIKPIQRVPLTLLILEVRIHPFIHSISFNRFLI